MQIPECNRRDRFGVFAGKIRWGAAFTLVEMLVVMAIAVLLFSLLVPAFNTIKGSGDLNGAAYDIAGLLGQARSYAMANNTYVFVGFAEVDSAQSTQASPQTVAAGTVGGRVAVMAFAAKDGTRGYSLTDPSASWTSGYAMADNGSTAPPGFRLTALTKLQRYENIHLVTLPDPGSGAMFRPAVNTTPPVSYQVGDSACVSVTPIAYPVGTGLTAGQYNFNKVIYFDPRGVARIQAQGNYDMIDLAIEIGLEPTHGDAIPTATPSPNQGKQAAVQIDCVSGTIRVYRP